MNKQTQSEAEIAHSLQLLVELNEHFSDLVYGNDNIYDIVQSINPNRLAPTDREVYNQIKSLVDKNEDIYKNIVPKGHSFNNPGTNNQHVAAAFFEDVNGNVYYAARGTGDGRWLDNAERMYEIQSEFQQANLEYFEWFMDNHYSEGINGNLILAGHSQGGNDAQYITLFSEKYRDWITLCFSFDGPGFSEEAYQKFLEDTEKKAKELGIDVDEYRNSILSKIYGIVGENDYVFFRGQHMLMPDGNVFIIGTPSAVDIMGYHFSHLMSGENGINWQRDKDGNIINGQLGPLGELSVILHRLEGVMRNDMPDVYRATALSIMSLLEANIGAGVGAGDIIFATPDQFKLFLEKGLPFILNGTGEIPGLKDRPELVLEILELMGIETHNISAEQAGIILNMLSDIAGNVDADILYEAIKEALFTPGEKADFTKIDWNLLLDALPPELLATVLNRHLPELLKSIKDNPELLETISDIISKNLGLDIDADKLADFLNAAGDLLSLIPGEKLAGLLLPIIRSYIENGELNITEILESLDVKEALDLIPYILEWNKDNPGLLKEMLDVFMGGGGAGGGDFGAILDWIKSNPELFKEISGELLKWMRENPEYAKEMGALIASLFNMPGFVGHAIAEAILWLPENMINDFINALASGDLKLIIPAGIAMLVAALPAIGISLIKQGFTWIVEQVKQLVQKAIEKITSAINAGIDFIGNIAKGVFDVAGGLLDAGVNLISGIGSVATQFGVEVLNALKQALPPQFSHIFDSMEGIIKSIDSAIQQAAEMAKSFLRSFKDALKAAVDAIVSGAKNAANALGNFISGLVGGTADAVKSLGSAACDAVGNIWKKATEVAWDAGKFIGEALSTAAKKMGDYIKTAPKTFGFDGNSMLAPIINLFTNWSFKPPRLKPPAPPPASPGAAVAILLGAKMSLSMNHLEQLQRSIADLINIWQNTFRVSQDSYIMANNASREYKQAGVQSAASEVRTVCSRIDNRQNDAYRDLVKMNDGLLQTIAGYRNLEASFV